MTKNLTNKEEEIMQALWKLEKAFVKEIVPLLPDPKPHYNTVSTTVRKMEIKGFVGHEAFGSTHRYYPLISKEDYRTKFVVRTLHNYFENSYKDLVSFFAKEEKISPEELKEIIDIIENKNKD
jgi:BlaI family transcriptional regulator, penicillinase repressor